jgi:hypothetical protein
MRIGVRSSLRVGVLALVPFGGMAVAQTPEPGAPPPAPDARDAIPDSSGIQTRAQRHAGEVDENVPVERAAPRHSAKKGHEAPATEQSEPKTPR